MEWTVEDRRTPGSDDEYQRIGLWLDTQGTEPDAWIVSLDDMIGSRVDYSKTLDIYPRDDHSSALKAAETVAEEREIDVVEVD